MTLARHVMCGWPPTGKVFFASWRMRSLAVMAPACRRGTRPLALMGSVDRTLIILAGSRCPMTLDRFRSIRRLTDIAITRFHPRKSSVLVSAGRSGRHGARPEVLLSRHHRPGDARHLVGQSDGGQFLWLALKHFGEPRIVPCVLSVQHRCRSVHQQAAQVSVAAFADGAEFGLAACTILSRHETER